MIKFFNVKTGETRILDPATMDPQFIEPAISALYNSSNLHVNATRGQDFGWRISPETVKRIRDIKRDDLMINRIAAGTQILPENLQDTDILTWIVKDDARKEALKNEEAAGDYNQQYEDELRQIGASPKEYNPATEIPSMVQPPAPAEEAETEADLEAQAAAAAKKNEKTPEQVQKEKDEEDRLMAELEAEEAEEQRLKEAGSEVGSPAEKQKAAEEAAATSEAIKSDEKTSTKAPEKVAKTQAKADNKSNS